MKDMRNLGKIITSKHERKWVAVSKDYKKVIAYSEKLADLEKKVDHTKVVFMKIPPADVYLSF